MMAARIISESSSSLPAKRRRSLSFVLTLDTNPVQAYRSHVLLCSVSLTSIAASPAEENNKEESLSAFLAQTTGAASVSLYCPVTFLSEGRFV